MLAIRLQRTGRKGHAQFRMVVQDSRRTPTSGRFVYLLGSYDPHSKTVQIDKEKAQFYLTNGARPSDRAARLLKAEGIKLPKWVQMEGKKKGALRNPEKLRKNKPADTEKKPVESVEAESAESAETEAVEETRDSEKVAEAVTEDTQESDKPDEAPAESSDETPTEE